MSDGAHQPPGGRVPVLSYGLGPIGLGVADLLAGRDGVTLVGAVDVDPDKIGTDRGLLTMADVVRMSAAVGLIAPHEALAGR